MTGITAVDRGVSWTLHFTDPTGLPVTIDVDTGWFVPQPQAWPLDLDVRRRDDPRHHAGPQRGPRAGFREPRREWRAETEAALAASGKLQLQATPTRSTLRRPMPGRFSATISGTGGGAPFPRVSMFRVGMMAIDLDALADFLRDRARLPGDGERDFAPPWARFRRPRWCTSPAIPTRSPSSSWSPGARRRLPSSINQVTFRVPSLPALQGCLRTHVRPSRRSTITVPVDHGNSFSLYCNDPGGQHDRAQPRIGLVHPGAQLLAARSLRCPTMRYCACPRRAAIRCRAS